VPTRSAEANAETRVSVSYAPIIGQMFNNFSVRSQREGRGVIVNVASMLGIVATAATTPATSYSATKHGVMGLTKTDAIFYAPQHIRINAMCPGYIETPLLLEATQGPLFAKELEKVPMGRLGKMEEIADGIVFLASPMSSFMCGHGLLIDG
jgi:NAD(P)-dependent dehydrogenase (short-subunit alcohol dehydrogenase family)